MEINNTSGISLPSFLTSDVNQSRNEAKIGDVSLALRNTKLLGLNLYSTTVHINSNNQTLSQIESVSLLSLSMSILLSANK